MSKTKKVIATKSSKVKGIELKPALDLKPNKPKITNMAPLPPPCQNCYNSPFVPEQLDLLDLQTQVVPMILNYKNNQHKAITNYGVANNRPQLNDDARSVYFSLKKLKSFIFEIEQLCCANQCNNVLGELGIRFYYAAYGRTMPTGANPAFAEKHTLVLVPTYTETTPIPSGGFNVEHIDFSPDTLNGTCTPRSFDQPGTYMMDMSLEKDTKKKLSSSKVKKSLNNKPAPLPIKSQKVMVLIGGYPAQKKVAKKAAKGGATPVVSSTIANHGDLIPPPSVFPTGIRYTDATLLNC